MSELLEYYICQRCGKRCDELDIFKSSILKTDKMVCEECFAELEFRNFKLGVEQESLWDVGKEALKEARKVLEKG